ncbi:MAG: hypothetical protein AVDCRST_MAG41-2268 [uncultured Corynebacteriales bacterium]|uniref:Exo-alpha-sialidase n=1 Tax=uncultured Mycobacteriales bacterium TaxID=581187 RepID=A0A6J4IQA6_9ACTN|nr:MAG: hypothetical protein AVDCRST_MAG41-2268 [uncultured Corynebacteriales bacterium]
MLDTGPPRRPTRRRWVTTAGALVLAVVAAVLAARSTTGRSADPAPAPARRPVLVSVAVGPAAVYALAARCDGTVPACDYQLHRRAAGADRWDPVPWRIGPLAGAGPAPTVTVSGAGAVTVVTAIDPPQVLRSTDDGRTVVSRPLRPGPPVAALPADGVLRIEPCDGCADRLTVVEPATGLARPLATQPPLGRYVLRSVDRAGDVVWAVAVDRRSTAGAVSTDGGRSWRAVPVPGPSSPNQQLRVLAGADGSAWLVAGPYTGGPAQQFTGVRRIDGPAGRWRQVDRSGPQTVRSVLAGRRGLLLVETNGAVWRLPPGGRFARLPEAAPYRPGDLVAGPGPILASISPDDATGRIVLLSDDEGGTWRAEQVV